MANEMSLRGVKKFLFHPSVSHSADTTAPLLSASLTFPPLGESPLKGRLWSSLAMTEKKAPLCKGGFFLKTLL